MPKLFNEDIAKQIKTILEQLNNPVTLRLFTQSGACPTCAETRQMLEEVADLSDQLTVELKDLEQDSELAKQYGITMTPSFVVLDANKEYHGVKFNGIPAGHEINSFISALLETSGLMPKFSPDVLKRIEKVNKPINIKVFVTLSCPHCPGAVQSAHRLAMLNEKIEGEMIEAQTFNALSNQYKVSGVPKIVINDTQELVGNQPIEAFLDAIESL